jgi:hypothetical protein
MTDHGVPNKNALTQFVLENIDGGRKCGDPNRKRQNSKHLKISATFSLSQQNCHG